MLEFLMGAVLMGLGIAVGGTAILIGKSGRQTIWHLIKERLGLLPPPAPPPPPPAPPPPEPEPIIPAEPEIRYGNILTIPEEQDAEPDLTNVYRFPEKQPPALPYADFNTRLFVVTHTPNGQGARRIYPTRVSDEPTRLDGRASFVDDLIMTQLRPVYRTILDPQGLFSQYSVRLQSDPFFKDAIVEAYLNVPINRRPVVVSVVGQPAPANKGQFLTFVRYGFEDFHFNLAFLNPNWATGLRHVFAAFMGSHLEWSNFSHARLRHAAALDDYAMAATANRLRAATTEAERTKQVEQELALDKMETFTSVFRVTAPAAAAQNSPRGEA